MNSMTIPAAESDFDYIAITGSVVYNAGIDASTALANEDIQDYLVLQVVVKKRIKMLPGRRQSWMHIIQTSLKSIWKKTMMDYGGSRMNLNNQERQ